MKCLEFVEDVKIIMIKVVCETPFKEWFEPMLGRYINFNTYISKKFGKRKISINMSLEKNCRL
jgi:hypothetical protein